eukprot:Skav209710  [mRNA]  locus=scaffold36:382506:386762:- [translate_table: standard]
MLPSRALAQLLWMLYADLGCRGFVAEIEQERCERDRTDNFQGKAATPSQGHMFHHFACSEPWPALISIKSQSILMISLCSSSEPLTLMSLKVSTTVQVLCASWALVGIPVVICAGVGVLYHVDHLLRTFFWYLLFSLPLGIAVPTWLLASGKAEGFMWKTSEQ